MEWKDGKLVIDSDFDFIQLCGEEYGVVDIVTPQGAIVWQNEAGVKVWRNLQQCVRWHWNTYVIPSLAIYGVLIIVGHFLKWMGAV